MVPGFRAFAGLLLVVAPLAGCVGDVAPDPATIDVSSTNDTEPNATLPDGRAFIGAEETNKTEEGVGGVDHKHDYWKGQDKDVVFDDRVPFDLIPVFPDGEGTSAKSVSYVKLPPPKLVYEGASLVQVLLSGPGVEQRDVLLPHPSPPKVSLQYRTAMDSEWREPVPLGYDTTLDLPVGALEADMPHSVTSLWVFRLTTDQPITGFSAQLTITAVKGASVADWPGHPDFYADKDVRVVLDRDVTTHMSGIAGGFLYDSGGTWVRPDKLVSHGTTRLEVFVNVTSIKSQTGQSATGYFLEHHNATVIGPEIRFGERWSDDTPPADLVAWNFTIPVTVDGMDGPYQPGSRWGFRAMATFADIGTPATGRIVGLCPGCFDYDISYHITVLAVSDGATATTV